MEDMTAARTEPSMSPAVHSEMHFEANMCSHRMGPMDPEIIKEKGVSIHVISLAALPKHGMARIPFTVA